MTTLSVLRGRTADDVQHEPFAHLVNEPVFPPAVYAELAAGFPPIERFLPDGFTPAGNQAVRIPAAMVLEGEGFSGLWQEFFRYHTSQEFWDDIARVFGPALRARHPGLEAGAGRPLEAWRSKLRGTEGPAEVALDVLFVINTAVERESSVRPAHVDYEEKIFAGLFYMRSPDDDTPGGDLALYRFHPGRAAFGGHYARLRDVEERKVIPYAGNEFAAFVNSPDSIHGVTPRPRTAHVRRYVNFVAETPFAAFTIPSLNFFQRLLFRRERRRTKEKGITLRY